MVTRKKSPVKIIKSKDFLQHICDTFQYLIDDCPMFYIKGVASTSLVERVKSRTKDHSFYYCPTPDGFSGVVLAGEVEDYVKSFEPLSIGGTTKKSQGKNYHRTDAQSRKEAEQFFNDNIRRTMHVNLASQPYSPLETIMTADYLLTAQDLPGWPAKDYFEVSYSNLLRKTFGFISRSSFASETLVRELKILREIAIQHDMLPLYNELLKKTRRKIYKRGNVTGFTYTNSIRFDGAEIGINDIFDASMAVPFVYNFVCQFKLSRIAEMVKNSMKVLWNRRYYYWENLPIVE